MNEYNRIAWVYDTLARWVFFGNILRSQIYFLLELDPHSHILIIGGGSGKVLEAMNQLNIPLTIDFIEPASAMIEKAKHRSLKLHNLSINFYQTKFQLFDSSKKYDGICCFYFLDLFKKPSLMDHLAHVKGLMETQGKLLVADFQNPEGHFWKNLLSVTMHAFFKLTTGLESKRLKDIHGLLIAHGFRLKKRKEFFSQFIFSAVYLKEVS